MNTQPLTSVHATQHDDWELRVQDWLDGEADANEAAAVQAHVSTCTSCQAMAQAWRELDEELGAIKQPSLDRQFDQALWAKIDADEAQRRAARERALAQEPALLGESLVKTLRRRMLYLASVTIAAVAAFTWVLVTSSFGITPTSMVMTLATMSPLEWLVVGIVSVAGTTAVGRWLYS